MQIKLSDSFGYKRLLRFTLPSIIMMIFTSVYGVVDGYFVSNFAGKTPFAALNLIYPFIMILGAFGFMFGTGGSALIAKTLGEGKRDSANKIFSFLVYVTIACGVAFAVLGLVFLKPIAVALGARGDMLKYALIYGGISLIGIPFYMLQFEFQSFFSAAEKPKAGLFVTLVAGFTNMLLDAVLVGVFPFGVAGAATATVLSQAVGGIIPLIYFARKRNPSLLHLGKARFDFKVLFKVCANGCSELMSNIAMSLVGMLYNLQLLHFSGENGVAAYGVMMYVNFIFLSLFIGYSVGAAPVISYHFGAENTKELKSLLKKSIIIMSVFSISMTLLALLLTKPLSVIFVGYDKELFALTQNGFYIFSFSFMFAGFAIFASSFFTALNNGPVSALISFLRTLVFQIAAVILLPLIFGVNGIWISVIAAEFMAVMVSLLMLIIFKKKYKY